MIYNLEEWEKFFDISINEVDHINRLIIIYTKKTPEWLRGKPKFYQIPRVSDENLNFFVKKDIFIKNEKFVERIVWIVENLEGKWNIYKEHIYFELETDVMYYTLKFL